MMKYIFYLIIFVTFVSYKNDEKLIVSSITSLDNIFLTGKLSVYPVDKIIRIDKEFHINNENFSEDVKYTIVNSCIVILAKLVESYEHSLYFSDISFDNNDLLITLCSKEDEQEKMSRPKIFIVVVSTNQKINNNLKVKMKDCE